MRAKWEGIERTVGGEEWGGSCENFWGESCERDAEMYLGFSRTPNSGYVQVGSSILVGKRS